MERLIIWIRTSISKAQSTILASVSSSWGEFTALCIQVLSDSLPSYLVGQIPSNMLLNRIRPSIYMSGWMMAWAIVSTLMAVVKDYKGMLACRFVLGIVEAPFYPGGVYLISMFYSKFLIICICSLLISLKLERKVLLGCRSSIVSLERTCICSY